MPKIKFGQTKEVCIQFTEAVLGTVPKSKDAYLDFVGIKAPTVEAMEEEVLTVEEAKEDKKGSFTGFHLDDSGLFVYDYWIRGFMKTAVETLQEAQVFKKIPAYKKWIDRMVFVRPRKLYFVGKDGKKIASPDGQLARPLRAMTPLGERITIAVSDFIAAKARLKFEVELLSNSKGLTWEVLATCMDYGQYVGLGQWRGVPAPVC